MFKSNVRILFMLICYQQSYDVSMCDFQGDVSVGHLSSDTTGCSVIGAWLGAFPIPLDWDRPWQVSVSLHYCNIAMPAALRISSHFNRNIN